MVGTYDGYAGDIHYIHSLGNTQSQMANQMLLQACIRDVYLL